MEVIRFAKFDFGYGHDFTIKKSDGSSLHISGYTCTLKLWQQESTDNVILSAGCTNISASLGTTRFTAASGDIAVLGSYIGKVELTRSGERMSVKVFKAIIGDSPF